MSNASRQVTRRAFTLVELVTSLAITSILMLGLSSVMLIGSKAVPSGDEQIHSEAACAMFLENMASELELANKINEVSTEVITIFMSDLDGDGSDDKIRYLYDADTSTIQSKWNGGDPVIMLQDVSSLNITLTKEDTRVTRVAVTIGMLTTATPEHHIVIDLYNKPELR